MLRKRHSIMGGPASDEEGLALLGNEHFSHTTSTTGPGPLIVLFNTARAAAVPPKKSNYVPALALLAMLVLYSVVWVNNSVPVPATVELWGKTYPTNSTTTEINHDGGLI